MESAEFKQSQYSTDGQAGNKAHLLLVTALQAEATPLIEHYQLKALNARAFRLYQADNVTLIVCGMGAMAAASATSYALGFQPQSCVAINVGIAGSDNSIGRIYHASSIARQGTQKPPEVQQGIFYPHLPFKSELPGIATITVDTSCTDYQPDSCFEMEAYGFCFAARQFIPAEQVHCLKIISDNPAAPVRNTLTSKRHRSNRHKSDKNRSEKNNLLLAKADISRLLADNIASIHHFADQLLQSCQSGMPASVQPHQLLQACDEYITAIENYTNNRLRFSASQKQQLNKLIRRYHVLGKILPQNLENKTGSELISALESEISTHLPAYKSGNETGLTESATESATEFSSKSAS